MGRKKDGALTSVYLFILTVLVAVVQTEALKFSPETQRFGA